MRRIIIAGLLAAGLPGTARGQDSEDGWRATLGMEATAPYEIYHGRVNLQYQNIAYAGQYRELTEPVMALQAGLRAPTSAGRLGVSVYGTKGTSTGHYTGVASAEAHERDLLSVGLDAGWRARVARTGAVTVEIPFGPSLLWQRLRLSQGHRNAYADPADGSDVPVDWADRRWVSYGGHGGVSLSLALNPRLGMWVAGTGRLLYYSTGSWAGEEERAIQKANGRTVQIGYREPMVLMGGAQFGVEWRP